MLGSWAQGSSRMENGNREMGSGDLRSISNSVYLAGLRNPISLQSRNRCRLQGSGENGEEVRSYSRKLRSPKAWEVGPRFSFLRASPRASRPACPACPTPTAQHLAFKPLGGGEGQGCWKRATTSGWFKPHKGPK